MVDQTGPERKQSCCQVGRTPGVTGADPGEELAI